MLSLYGIKWKPCMLYLNCRSDALQLLLTYEVVLCKIMVFCVIFICVENAQFTSNVYMYTSLAQRHALHLRSTAFYMMTSSNGNIFRVTGPLCGEFACHRWMPLTKASDAKLWCFFHLRLNKRLSKQSWGWWFETSSRSLWRRDDITHTHMCMIRDIGMSG